MIKAIETMFDGYRFRSRLEARWAVFFSSLGVSYDYEVEGFDLPSGRYLPDFWLPEEKSFVEIKPGPMPEDLDTRHEMRLAFELMVASKKRVYVFYGNPFEVLAPGYPGMTGFSPDKEDDDGLTFLYLKNYEAALLKAKQARFEHGESGAPLKRQSVGEMLRRDKASWPRMPR